MGRKHPLDVFRSTGDGFEKASRKRRTVQGKVISSSVRQRAEGSGKRSSPSRATPKSTVKGKAAPRTAQTAGSAARPGASARSTDRVRVTAPARPKPAPTQSRSASSKAASAAKSRRLAGLFTGGPARSPSARKADGATRNLFYGAVVLLAVLALVIVFQQTWLDTGPGELPQIPIKKMEEVLPPGPGGSLPSSAGADAAGAGLLAPEWFTIQASVYNGSEKGLALAFAAQNELIVRGLPNVTVIGHEGDEPSSFDSYELIVGHARTRAALEATLDRMLSIDDWSGGARAPFLDARIVAHPQPAGLDD